MNRLPNTTSPLAHLPRTPSLGVLTVCAALMAGACASTSASNPPATQPTPTAQAAPTPASPAPTPAPAPAPAATPAAPAPAAPAAATAAAGGGGVYTAAQAKRGAGFFNSRCSVCHQRDDFAGQHFLSTWGGAPAGELFMLISTTMPQDNPASLALQEYADILAYLLSMNGMPAGDRELPGNQDALNAILIQKPAQ